MEAAVERGAFRMELNVTQCSERVADWLGWVLLSSDLERSYFYWVFPSPFWSGFKPGPPRGQ